MVLRLYIDDSDSPESPERKAFVLGGYIATPEAWTRFEEDWRDLLEPFDIPRGESGRRRFRMVEMARRFRDARPFYETIVRHVLGAVSLVIYEDELEAAKARVRRHNGEIPFTPFDDGRTLVKKILVQQLHEMMADPSILLMSEGTKRFGQVLAENRDGTEIYFHRDESEPCMTEWWQGYISAQQPDLDVPGTQTPQFVDDEEHLPLQAADFWAWWAWQAYENGSFQDFASGNFGSWQGSNGPPMLVLTTSEDDLADYLMEAFAASVPAGSAADDTGKQPGASPAMYVDNPETGSRLSRFDRLLERFRRRPG